MLCSDVAVCSAIRLGGSALPSSRRPATGPDSISCRRWGTLAPPPWRRVLPAGPRPSPLRSTAGRRAALVLTSAHALEACSAACPLHCLRARGDVRLSSELSPSLTHSPGAAPPAPRRGRSRGLCALPTRGSAGGRHHRHSRASRGRSFPSRHYGKGGGRRARVCGCVRPDDGEAAAPQPLCSKRAPRRGLASPASPTRASCSVLGEAPARGARASGPVASACGAAASPRSNSSSSPAQPPPPPLLPPLPQLLPSLPLLPPSPPHRTPRRTPRRTPPSGGDSGGPSPPRAIDG